MFTRLVQEVAVMFFAPLIQATVLAVAPAPSLEVAAELVNDDDCVSLVDGVYPHEAARCITTRYRTITCSAASNADNADRPITSCWLQYRCPRRHDTEDAKLDGWCARSVAFRLGQDGWELAEPYSG